MDEKTKILYIDDEDINLELFKYSFDDKFDVITDCCGMKGLECLKKYPNIKVVISDMKMPNMSGLEFITKAKSIYSEKVYYILTGYDITEEIKDALESNLILNYFRKPFNVKEIEKAIYEVI